MHLQLHAIDVAAGRIVSGTAGPDDVWADDFPFEGDVGAVTGFLRAAAELGPQQPFGYYRISRLVDGRAVGGIGYKSQPFVRMLARRSSGGAARLQVDRQYG